MTYRLAFDIGGTFTDFVLYDRSTNASRYWKTLSTPHNPAVGVITALEQLLKECEVEARDLDEIVHATTVAANAVIERKGAQTGLITTDGFRDVVLIGRQKRYETYDLRQAKPTPLIQRRRIAEVGERVSAQGQVLRELEQTSLGEAIEKVLKGGSTAVAVSLLHSYANADHERQIRDRLREVAPDVYVSLSSEVAPQIGEYERTSTTVADAYVKPIVAKYLDDLRAAFARFGFTGRFYIMQSNGGISTPELVREQPVRIVESGPAAGVLMATAVGTRASYDQVLTFDMGGTTAKVGAIDGGKPSTTDFFEIDVLNYRKGSGLPLSIPVIELLEIGAGGGSIAEPHLGTIRVGPESAGSEPGPVCYQRGGTRCTVTDANLALGYLNPEYFVGGKMSLDGRGAVDAIREQIAQPLELDLGEAAWGIHAMANANMERALRIMSIERGRDPRAYTLVAFGGAGPLHAARLAKALAIPRVLIPEGAGVGSAVGLLGADLRFDLTMSRVLLLDQEAADEIVAGFANLKRRLLEQFHLETAGQLVWSQHAYIRYCGQGHELRVDLPSALAADSVTIMRRSFDDAYRRTYGYVQSEVPCEIVNWGATAHVETRSSNGVSGKRQSRAGSLADARKGERSAYFPELHGYANCNVWDRYKLPPGDVIQGPAIIEERESTTIVPPGDSAVLNEHSDLVITVRPEDVGNAR